MNSGESMDFVFSRGGLTISGWECTVKLKQYPADSALVDRVITPKDGEWPGFLTPAETAALTVGITYFLTAELVNASTGEIDQVDDDVRLSITADWAA